MLARGLKVEVSQAVGQVQVGSGRDERTWYVYVCDSSFLLRFWGGKAREGYGSLLQKGFAGCGGLDSFLLPKHLPLLGYPKRQFSLLQPSFQIPHTDGFHLRLRLERQRSHMGQQERVRTLQQRVRDLRFVFVHVQSRAGDCALREGRSERGFVDDGPAGGVD